jgi:hypothetical protein
MLNGYTLISRRKYRYLASMRALLNQRPMSAADTTGGDRARIVMLDFEPVGV